MATAFEHSPLDPTDLRAFRVLELLPSWNLKGPIHVEIRHCSLDQDIKYEALSYAWGRRAPGYHVVVNGSFILDVTPSCVEALMHLRQRFHRRTLWIDAICINQRTDDTSKRERNHQVRFMSEIYRKARKVIIWLGPAEPSTARTIRRLKILAKLYTETKSTDGGHSTISTGVSPHLWIARLRSLSVEKLSYRMFEEQSQKPRYQAIASMIHSPWWQRVWTLQEQVLANECEVHHGRQSISMRDLICPPLLIKYVFLTEPNFFLNHYARERTHHHRWQVDDLGSVQPHRPTIPSPIDHLRVVITQSLLNAAFLLQAESPVDKIYGLYGILTTYCALPIPVPDYTKTAEDVYEETVWAWISHRNDLNILKLAVRPGRVYELPSWVPAWHSEHPNPIATGSPEGWKTLAYGHFSWTYTSQYHMRQEPIPVATLLSSGKLQILRARYVGRVSHAIGVDKPAAYLTEGLAQLHLRWCRLVHNVFSYSTPMYEEALDEMFRSLLIPGIYEPSYEDGQSVDRMAKRFQLWFNFMLYTDHESRSPTSTSPLVQDTEVTNGAAITYKKGTRLYLDVVQAEQVEEAVNLLVEHHDGDSKGRGSLSELAMAVRETIQDLIIVRNYALCILDNDNMMAVANYWCREGDEVFVFPNTDCPFVLRREPDGASYRLVGPTLVDRLKRIGYQKWRAEGEDLRDITLV